MAISVSCETLEISVGNPELKASKEDIYHFEVEVVYEGETWKDYGVIMLPRAYNLRPSETDLVLYCHSGGGTVDQKSSECESMGYNKYLVSKGYAVLSMAAMPVEYAEALKIDRNRTVGSSLSLECMKAGYAYIKERFRFSENVFLLSNSNGGLLASNLVHFSQIPFKAQCGIAPLISIEENAWNIINGRNSGGRFSRYQNRANIIALYHMKDCLSLSDLNNAYYEKNKVGSFDPYDYYLNSSESLYPVPYLIFSCIKDETVFHSIAQSFANAINKKQKGQIAIDTTTSLGAHNVSANPKILGTFVYKDSEYDLNEVYCKIDDFFKKFTDGRN